LTNQNELHIIKININKLNGDKAMKRVNLNSKPIAIPDQPKEQTVVSKDSIDELNKFIKQKIRQNEAERTASMEIAGRYVVK